VKLGLIERLGITNPAVFDQVETNPTEAMVLGALEMYRNLNCDGIVAVGGGSPIDLAKCVRILVHHAPPLVQYAFRWEGISRITPEMPPLIAVPKIGR